MSAVMQSRGQFGLYKIPWVNQTLHSQNPSLRLQRHFFSALLGGILTN